MLLSGTRPRSRSAPSRLRAEHEVDGPCPARLADADLHELAEQLGAGLSSSAPRTAAGSAACWGSVTAACCTARPAPWPSPRAVRRRGQARAHRGRLRRLGREPGRAGRGVGLALFAGGTVDSYTVMAPVAQRAGADDARVELPRRPRRVSARTRGSPRGAGHRGRCRRRSGPPKCRGPGRRNTRRHLGDADLLVCGSRGYGALRAVALGGVSRALVNEAACPVLVDAASVRAAASRGPRRPPARVDPELARWRRSTGPGRHRRLGARRDALALAQRLVDPEPGELILAHVDGDRSFRLPRPHQRDEPGAELRRRTPRSARRTHRDRDLARRRLGRARPHRAGR